MSVINWTNALGGDWAVGTNWDLGLAPASTNSAQISLPGNYTVSISSQASAASLAINASGATLAESSAGSLTLSGGLSLYNGVVSLNGANSFGGAVQLIGGVVAVGNGGALRNGDVLLSGGELLAMTTQTMTTSMAFSDAPTIAAETGQTLSLQGSAQLSGATTLIFGASGEPGTILWKPTSFQLLGGSTDNLDIRGGKLVFGNFDEGLTALSSTWNSVDIEAGATLDLSGVPASFSNLLGRGTLTGSSTSLVTIGGGRFSGNLTGFLNLNITGQVELAGSSTVGAVQIGNGGSFTSLTNDVGGVVDLDTDSDMSISPGASNAYFVNEGTVLRNGIGGSSVVSVPFLNYGAMRITTGSVTFTDGFANSGTVEGRLTANSDGTTTWTPNPAETGSVASGLLWQNADGLASIWALNGTSVTGGGAVNPDPGPSRPSHAN